MNIFKKVLKHSHVYRFLNNNFSSIKTNIDMLNNKMLTLEQAQKQFENSTNNQLLQMKTLQDSTESNINNQLLQLNNLENIINNQMFQLTSLHNNIENQILQLNSLHNNIDLLISKNDLISTRTKQFDFINTELLLLNNNINKVKVLIVGFYGAPNSGDELMLQSILDKIDTSSNSITVMLADNPSYDLSSYKNINFIHYPKTNMDINIIANYFDKIVFGGGALIDDTNYNKENSYQFDVAKMLIDLSISALLKGKKIYCIGLSSSKELINRNYISKLEFIIKKSNYFSLRDSLSYDTLKFSGIDKTAIEKIDIIHDLVFSLSHKNYEIPNESEINIGLVLIGFSEHKKLIDIINWVDKYFVDKKLKVNLHLIPFYDFCHSDIENYKQILNNLNIKSNIIIEPYYQNYNEIAKCFCNCNMIINMRYHSSLLCLKLGIPAVHLSYDIHPHYNNKMNFLKNKYSLDKMFLSYIDLNKQDLINCLNYVLENSNEISLNEKIISKKIENEAIESHIKIINKILEN